MLPSYAQITETKTRSRMEKVEQLERCSSEEERSRYNFTIALYSIKLEDNPRKKEDTKEETETRQADRIFWDKHFVFPNIRHKDSQNALQGLLHGV